MCAFIIISIKTQANFVITFNRIQYYSISISPTFDTSLFYRLSNYFYQAKAIICFRNQNRFCTLRLDRTKFKKYFHTIALDYIFWYDRLLTSFSKTILSCPRYFVLSFSFKVFHSKLSNQKVFKKRVCSAVQWTLLTLYALVPFICGI